MSNVFLVYALLKIFLRTPINGSVSILLRIVKNTNCLVVSKVFCTI